MNKGFTIIEIVVVLGIFGILILVGTDFLISVIQNNNRSAIESEVRQNASKLLGEVSSSIRLAACVKWFPQPLVPAGDITIQTYGDTECTSSLIDEYKIFYDPSNRKNQGKMFKNNRQISANGVAVLDCTGASQCGTSCVNGFSISATPMTNGSVTITMVVQATTSAVRSDFCAVTKLSDTVTPRIQF